MYCSKCGNKILENSKFCASCGNPVISSTPVTNVTNNNQVVSTKQNKFKFDINKIIIGVIAVIVLIVVCHIGYSIVLKNQTRTIMIYMVGADLESGSGLASRDLLDLDYKKINANNTKVVLMAGGSKGWHNTYIDSNKTAIYELGPNGFTIVDNHELTNMGNSENLSYFLNYVHDNYKTSKYNFIFWNHGGAVDGSEYDELNNSDNLSIPEIKQAFENGPFKGNNKLEVISFRTCLNATLEIANTLKDYGKYLVASEEVTVGSRFDSALGFINQIKPTDKPEVFGRKQIDCYTRTVTTACNAEQEVELDKNLCVNFTYSIIDLSKINAVNKELDTFSLDVNKKLASNYNDVVKVRASLKQYPLTDADEYDMVDLINLANGLTKYSSNAKSLINSVNNAVVYNSTNNDYSNGLSIYFPYNSASFLTKYPNLTASKNYSDLLFSFYNMKNTTKVSSFNTFSMKKGSAKTTKEGGADFEIDLTADQVNNFAKASCFVFVDMKDGYHKLVYVSTSPYLDGNKLKAKVRGKMLRISDIEYEDTSEWLQLIEQNSGEDFTESNVIAILKKGLKNDEIVNITVRVDKEHPNGFIKSIVSTSKDKKGEAKFFSSSAIKLTDFTFIEVANQSYKITDANGKFDRNFLKNGNGIYTGMYFATNMIKLIPEDFNSKYDYYGVFAIKDVAGNSYYSDVVKMN